ncbi:PREDICTED: D-3-phosphoglycerate dehydrogenase 1, chloroplastic-like [Ipomoea nil]|uniref:D-3-phosphoglycerate dehydrogenase 1, chloroplastic-like n=1 Tax=Ipomoea nil TaxID=35883 RepID=UPI000901271B|nr:PREDICTED: D-3-phosphoglycerate dehydrogenase 1, chloroplastic-like [Ipomoea nil]
MKSHSPPTKSCVQNCISIPTTSLAPSDSLFFFFVSLEEIRQPQQSFKLPIMATIPKNSISFRASMPACPRSRNPKISHLSFFHSSPNSIPLRLVSHGSRRSAGSFQVRNVFDTVQSADVPVSGETDLKPRVLVSEKLGDAGLELLRGFGDVDCSYDLSPEELCNKISEFDALIVRSGTKVTRQVFEAAKGRLKVVGRAGVGIDNVDLQAATEFGCLVVNAPTANTIAAAEHGIALLASMARNVAQADASIKSGNWQRNKYVGVSLVGKTLAVMGFGKVGSEVARRAKGLGMHVVAHDPYAPADKARAVGVDLVSFDQAISSAHFISLHMPLTPATEKVFNDETFAKMKKGVRLINVARGGVIDEEALVRALDNGTVAQAALDVFTEEPPAKDSKLVLHEKVTVTPHLGASTKEAQEGVAVEVAEAVVGALKGELSATSVNAPMVPPEVLSELAPYVVLAEKLGRMAVQLVAGGSGIQSIKIVYKTARSPDSLDTRLLRAMVTKGIIEPISDTYINLVNADFTAKQKGLRISEERVYVNSSTEDPVETIQVQISSVKSKFASALMENGNICAEGRVKDSSIPHLTCVGSYSVDVSLDGNLILCRQVDQPGMIGKVGNILAESNVNVSFMSVGRTGRRTTAIMAIGVDEEPTKDTLKKIGEVAAIEEFVFLKL